MKRSSENKSETQAGCWMLARPPQVCWHHHLGIKFRPAVFFPHPPHALALDYFGRESLRRSHPRSDAGGECGAGPTPLSFY